MLNGSRAAAEAEELRAGLAAETGAEIGYTQATWARPLRPASWWAHHRRLRQPGHPGQ
jgi:hypothetical protein